MTPLRGSPMGVAFRSVAAIVGLAGLYVQVVRGALTLDLGIGRRVRPLGPLKVRIRAAVADIPRPAEPRTELVTCPDLRIGDEVVRTV